MTWYWLAMVPFLAYVFLLCDLILTHEESDDHE